MNPAVDTSSSERQLSTTGQSAVNLETLRGDKVVLVDEASRQIAVKGKKN